MSQITNFKIKPADYRGRDEIIVRRSDFNQETLETEAKNTLYYLFSYAHGKRCHLAYTKPACSRVAANISSRGPKVLEPPWTAISDPTHPLIDAKFFPPNFPMSDPAVMRQPRRVELLHHILNLEHLQFHHWKPRNGTPQLPVPLDLRYWADEQRDQEARQLELAREKALDARPTHTSNDDYEDYGSAGEDVVPDGPAGQPVAGPSTQRLSDPPTLRPTGPRLIAPLPLCLSLVRMGVPVLSASTTRMTRVMTNCTFVLRSWIFQTRTTSCLPTAFRRIRMRRAQSLTPRRRERNGRCLL